MPAGIRIAPELARRILRALKGKKANVHRVAQSCGVSHTTVLRVQKDPDLYLRAMPRNSKYHKPKEPAKPVRCPTCGHKVFLVEGRCFECFLIRTRTPGTRSPLPASSLPPLPRNANRNGEALACSKFFVEYAIADIRDALAAEDDGG